MRNNNKRNAETNNQPRASATPPAPTAYVLEHIVTALAIVDPQRPKGMRVVFGLVNDDMLVPALELDNKCIVITSPQQSPINIAEHIANGTYIAHTALAARPAIGQLWNPRFATKMNVWRTTNQFSSNLPSEVDYIDGGELADMAARYTVAETAQEVLNSASSHQEPPVAAGTINGAQLRKLLNFPPIDIESRPELVNRALVPSTVQEHQRMLLKLADLPEKYHHWQAPLAISSFLWHQSVELQWKPTTLFKYMCTAQGALRILPLYRLNCPSIFLSGNPTWAMVMRGSRHAAVEHVPDQPKAATIPNIITALKATRGFFKEHVRVVIMLAWLTTSRLGCIRQLKSEDLVFNDTARTINISFRRGKGVRARKQAYTVTTLVLSPAWWKEIKEYVASRPRFLFPASLKDTAITTPLKAAGIEQRSIRRGALQAMAADKVTPEIMMNFSGHSSVQTLNRYLDFGKKRADLAQASTQAALSLWNNQLLDDAWLETEQNARTSSSS